MNKEATPIKRALISVSDKTNLIELAQTLTSLEVEIISTGNTAQELRKEGIKVIEVTSYTGFPEIFGGRVKTLHPKIAGGILARRHLDQAEATKHAIDPIDLVVCNLYPFAEAIKKESVTLEEACEQVDIGGVTLLRSAAKNFGWVTVLSDPTDYPAIQKYLLEEGAVPYHLRKTLATKAFAHTAHYDALIFNYLNEEEFPLLKPLSFTKAPLALRYAENPHQRGAVYKANSKTDKFSLLECPPLQGKQLSYNNLYDAYGAVETLREFRETACVIVKHATPCGVAQGATPLEALKKAYNADSLSAFGGIVTLNREVTEEVSLFLKPLFIELLLAPSFTAKALQVLKQKPNLRVIATGEIPPLTPLLTGRFIGDDLLVQQRDNHVLKKEDLEVVTKREASSEEIEDLLFAWKVVKHVKSNAIVTAKGGVTKGIGGGQVSRIDALKIALSKGEGASVLASDAFFPFRDSIDYMAGRGVTAIVQPGGSIRDKEVIAACDEAGLAMVFTGIRAFLHG